MRLTTKDLDIIANALDILEEDLDPTESNGTVSATRMAYIEEVGKVKEKIIKELCRREWLKNAGKGEKGD